MINPYKEVISGAQFKNGTQEETKTDYFSLLPTEIMLEIFSYLNAGELETCRLVNKKWQMLASDKTLWKVLPPLPFGKKQWEKYFGDVGKVPPITEDIHKILQSPCPFWPGKKVKETHMLVLRPVTVNGKSLNLATLEELVKTPKEGGHKTQYGHIWRIIVNDEHVNQATAKSYWMLMTTDVIPGSRNNIYSNQKALIAKFANQTKINYEVPNAVDSAICIFMHHVGSGQRLFIDAPVTYTRCQENIQSIQVVVGGFSRAGLNVNASRFDYDDIGVAALRKFF